MEDNEIVIESTKSYKEMADVFIRAGEFFKRISAYGDNSIINMHMSPRPKLHDSDKHICKTPACVGGWLAVMYDLEYDEHMEPACFIDGADAFSSELGFDSRDDFLEFFDFNYEIWGSRGAAAMFHNPSAYKPGAYKVGDITQLDISEKFFEVAGNLQEAA